MSEGYRKTMLLLEKQGNPSVSRNMSFKEYLMFPHRRKRGVRVVVTFREKKLNS